MTKQEINIVWFKRDLRLQDHEPLWNAQQSGVPLLLVYIFEPSVMAYDDSDVRHWRFVYESLKELNEDAEQYLEELNEDGELSLKVNNFSLQFAQRHPLFILFFLLNTSELYL
jgi:hypothetical protein